MLKGYDICFERGGGFIRDSHGRHQSGAIRHSEEAANPREVALHTVCTILHRVTANSFTNELNPNVKMLMPVLAHWAAEVYQQSASIQFRLYM